MFARHWNEPLYGDYTRSGIVISFFIRIVLLIFKTLFFFIQILYLSLAVLFYLVILPLGLIMFFYQIFSAYAR